MSIVLLLFDQSKYKSNELNSSFRRRPILDFDFGGRVRPSTHNITDAIVGLKIQGFDQDRIDLIKQVYDILVTICGYSFSDLYVNQLHQRYKLIHREKERVIIIEKWPDKVNAEKFQPVQLRH